MNNYIMIGSYRYKTPADSWEPVTTTPRTIRILQDGSIDATYANITIYEWNGIVEASVSPETNYGTPAQLKTSLDYKGSVSFQDHYGTSYPTAYVSRSGPLKSKTPMWDGNSNVVSYEVTIVAEGS